MQKISFFLVQEVQILIPDGFFAHFLTLKTLNGQITLDNPCLAIKWPKSPANPTSNFSVFTNNEALNTLRFYVYSSTSGLCDFSGNTCHV